MNKGMQKLARYLLGNGMPKDQVEDVLFSIKELFEITTNRPRRDLIHASNITPEYREHHRKVVEAASGYPTQDVRYVSVKNLPERFGYLDHTNKGRIRANYSKLQAFTHVADPERVLGGALGATVRQYFFSELAKLDPAGTPRSGLDSRDSKQAGLRVAVAESFYGGWELRSVSVHPIDCLMELAYVYVGLRMVGEMKLAQKVHALISCHRTPAMWWHEDAPHTIIAFVA